MFSNHASRRAASATQRSVLLRSGVAAAIAVAGALGCTNEDAPAPPGAPLEGCVSRECGPPIEEFFEPQNVATLRLEMDRGFMSEAGYDGDRWEDLMWDKWNSHCGPYEWIPVSMTYESGAGVASETLESVGLRLRGSKSRGQNPLAGFKLDYDKLIGENDRRRFADLNRLEVLSNESDPSDMLQCLSYQLFRDFGLPAPRCNHLQVFINGQLYGLMESVERPKDGRYLRHHFDDNNEGVLLGGSESCGFGDSLADLDYYGDTLGTEYAAAYEIIRGSAEEFEATIVPMFKCGSLAATPDESTFRSCIASWLNLEQWLRTLVVESLTPSVEGFLGARRNFFLYFKPDVEAPHGGRVNVWTWDHDTALQAATCFPSNCDPMRSVAGWYGPRGTRSPLLNRLISSFKPAYCELAREYVDDVYDPDKVLSMAATIEPFVDEDPVLSPIPWQTEVMAMHDFMVSHRASLRDYLSEECRDEPAADWDLIRGGSGSSVDAGALGPLMGDAMGVGDAGAP